MVIARIGSEIILTPFTKNVIDIIRTIPKGKVMTYGQIARLAGNPRAARQVARILHSMSGKYHLPWHRVVNSKGQIVVGEPEQQILNLEMEGVEIGPNRKVDLECYQMKESLSG